MVCVLIVLRFISRFINHVSWSTHIHLSLALHYTRWNAFKRAPLLDGTPIPWNKCFSRYSMVSGNKLATHTDSVLKWNFPRPSQPSWTTTAVLDIYKTWFVISSYFDIIKYNPVEVTIALNNSKTNCLHWKKYFKSIFYTQ